MERLGRLPLFVLMIGISGAMMLVPAVYAALTHYHQISRIFLLSGVLMLVLAALLGVATSGREITAGPHGRAVLATMLSAFVVLPLALVTAARVPLRRSPRTTLSVKLSV